MAADDRSDFSRKSGSDNGGEKPKIEVEVVRYRWLFDIIERPKLMWRVIFFLISILVLFFFGLSLVTIALKNFYPYNTIKTSLYGYTSFNDEEKEVIYWLFNTADLWANSGIEVHKDDVLTIRASGAMHTAIHHLVKEAEGNKTVSDKWSGTEGLAKPETGDENRDARRGKHRIAANLNENVLLMQVIPYADANNSPGWLSDDNNQKYIDGEGATDIYVIGKERQNLVIRTDGVLHFAVNDIALTPRVIDDMYKNDVDLYVNALYADNSSRNGNLSKCDTDTLLTKWKGLITSKNIGSIDTATIKKLFPGDRLHNKPDDFKNDPVFLKTYQFGPPPSDFKIGDKPATELYPFVNELVYYKQKKFVDAWFVDNIGSFLIIIERKRR